MARDPYARWWRREGNKRGRFRYFDADGARIRDQAVIARIDKLAIPPAWTDVRIAPRAGAKVQCVGRDVKGRLQYRYHAKWTAKRADAKYAKLVAFAQALPGWRAATSAHLAQDGLGREKVLALVTRLIGEACFRIGGERYERENGSYGIATLMNRHMQVGKDGLRFAFRGKRGVQQRKVVSDPELAALAAEVKALPGKRAFQYVREDGTIAPITGHDVNAYIKSLLGPRFSAKDFRTWGATLRAARWLAAQGPLAAPTKTGMAQQLRRCVCHVSEHLGNTPAICRTSYVSPRVLEAYANGFTLKDYLPPKARRVRFLQQGHTPEELELMLMLAAPAPEPTLRVSLLPARSDDHERVDLVQEADRHRSA